MLQALRALLHSYPKIVIDCWEHVFAIVHNYMEVACPEVSTSPRKGLSGNTVGVNREKVTAAAVKVLYLNLLLPNHACMRVPIDKSFCAIRW